MVHGCFRRKCRGEKEPVIPKQIQIVLSVYGLDAIGQRIKDCCFRPELVAQVLGKAVEEVLTEEDLAGLAVSAKGGKKECPAGNGFLYCAKQSR
ncbi:MAG: selenium cofactor biosynthesis protein YqeC [Coprococcus sp.]